MVAFRSLKYLDRLYRNVFSNTILVINHHIHNMNYREEQENELEALSEIYYNEIEVISKEPLISLSIRVHPQGNNFEEYVINGSGGDSTDEEEYTADLETSPHGLQQDHLFVELKFELPLKYPNERPKIEILKSQNLVEEELLLLLNKLEIKARESLGAVMILELVSDTVEWLVGKSEDEANEVELENEKLQKEIEAEERKKFATTPVTVQSFMAWKLKFDAELLKANLEYQKRQEEQNGNCARRLTGREMFESDKTLAESDLNFVEELDTHQIEALLENIEEFDLDEDGEDSEEDVIDEEVEDDDDDDDDET